MNKINNEVIIIKIKAPVRFYLFHEETETEKSNYCCPRRKIIISIMRNSLPITPLYV